MAERVLMIDDDQALVSMVSDYLAPFGIEITRAATTSAGLAKLREGGFEALILDVMLPDIDGFEAARRIRAGQVPQSDIPILMLTARGEETDRIIGLELGTDDYLPKPFSPRELLARLRAILRRRAPLHIPRSRLSFGRLEIERDTRSLRIDGIEHSLTAYQFDLLWVLATHAGRVMSRDDLMAHVRGDEPEVFDRSIDVHISRIRAII